MKKTLFFIFAFLLSISLASAIDMKVGAILDDGNYTYEIKTDFTLSSLLIDAGEIYLDGDAFCDSSYENYFITDRNCPSIKPHNTGGGSTYFKRNCEIVVTPKNLELNSKELNIQILNNESNGNLYLSFDLDEENDFFSKLTLSNNKESISAGKNYNLTLKTTESVLSGSVDLLITSSVCYDVIVPVKLSLGTIQNQTNDTNSNTTDTSDEDNIESQEDINSQSQNEETYVNSSNYNSSESNETNKLESNEKDFSKIYMGLGLFIVGLIFISSLMFGKKGVKISVETSKPKK